jgi:hypothetical protein
VLVSKHIPPQQTWLLGQSKPRLPQVHWPFLHVSPLAQTWPQAPQLFVSPRVPPAQAQLPLWQVWPLLQTLPHVPQLLLSLCVLIQAPLQLVCPAGQAQTPAVQIPPLGEEQLVPSAFEGLLHTPVD